MTDWRMAPFQPGDRVLVGHPSDTDEECIAGTIVRPWNCGNEDRFKDWYFDVQCDDDPNGDPAYCQATDLRKVKP